ncbi:hypothetical protein, partial [Lacticaseibacillus paracasei]|uniref:hypothetical protein n=1 Tax=Lacticaseibacillus paracasei TaxID=1597 RepID=UPI0023303603
GQVFFHIFWVVTLIMQSRRRFFRESLPYIVMQRREKFLTFSVRILSKQQKGLTAILFKLTIASELLP